jgi:hypothetical protein
MKLLINREADENIIAITGKAGVHPVFGKRVCELSFVIYNRLTGHSIVAGVSSISRSKYPYSPFLIF